MATTMSVNKQTVIELLSSGKTKPFLIPEYQRPYAWTEEEATLLFEDLWEFAKKEPEEEATYFLGCIVSYENEEKEQEIIDGQQRITSLFLLLRAIYTKLMGASDKSQSALNFISKIEQSIWKTEKFTGAVDFSKVLLTSRVVSDSGNEVLKNILSTGKTEKGAKDHYSCNYNLFLELYQSISNENPMLVDQFIYSLLNQAILLPITADCQDTALTIFSTLNNRGLPLSDADIFKAKIYNQINADEKDTFIQEWQTLSESAINVGEEIQKLFTYYMFYLRAKGGERSTTLPALRKYYLEKNTNRLYNPSLLPDLKTSLNLWKVIRGHQVLEDEPWSKNKDIIQSLDILSEYRNEFWKYPVVIYYLEHGRKENFEKDFLKFLRNLTVFLLSRYLERPYISAVKGDILKLNESITKSAVPTFEFQDRDLVNRAVLVKTPPVNAVRMLLKILAYEEQDHLFPEKWEVEHIFPQTWQPNYFPIMDESLIREKIEHLGNKLPLEKKLNGSAGNGYFRKKQEAYVKSSIELTKAFGGVAKSDWVLDDITERDVRVSDSIEYVLTKWSEEYGTKD